MTLSLVHTLGRRHGSKGVSGGLFGRSERGKVWGLEQVQGAGMRQRLSPGVNAQFAVDVVQMLFHRAGRQDEFFGGGPVGEARCDQAKNLNLALAERLQQSVWASERSARNSSIAVLHVWLSRLRLGKRREYAPDVRKKRSVLYAAFCLLC